MPRLAHAFGLGSIVNLYNRANVEAWFYRQDFRERRGQVAIPILPVVGLALEY